MAVRWAITGGTFSNPNIWNDGATLGIPTSADDVFSNGFTVNVDTNINVISLNNVARARDVATPIMTGFATPSGQVTQSGQFGNSPGWLMFDQNNGTLWDPSSAAGWVAYEFPTARRIIAYNVIGNLSSWQFQYWDGSTWVTLHSASGTATGGGYTSPDLVNPNLYTRYRLNILTTAGSNQQAEFRMYEFGTATIAAGGNFNFNTSNVTANLSGAINLTTMVVNSVGGGTITINAPNSYIPPSVNGLQHSGTANLVFNSLGNYVLGINSGSQVVHSSTGNLTLSGTIYQHQTGSAGGTNRTIDSSGTGSIIINGNLEGQISGRGGEIAIIKTSSGGITITGNVSCRGNITIQSTTISGLTIGGNLQNNSNSGNAQIILGSPTVTVSGNVSNGGTALFQSTGGVINVGGNVTNTSTTNATISTNFTTINVNGNASTTNAGAAVSSTISSTINILGNASASTNQNAVFVTNSTAQVYLRGNMFNVNGKMGIYAPIIWLDQTGTTQARFFTSGGSDRTLYSDNTFPTQPPLSDVRYLTQFGPSSGLTGTLRMATPTDVRSGVATDNTVGTALFDTSQLLAELNASSDPIAQRLRIAATPEILGQLIAAYKR